MTRSAAPRAACRDTPPFAHPTECTVAETCVVVHLEFRDGSARWGVPLGVVGEMVRFRALFPRTGTLLVPFEELEPSSVERAVRGFRDGA